MKWIGKKSWFTKFSTILDFDELTHIRLDFLQLKYLIFFFRNFHEPGFMGMMLYGESNLFEQYIPDSPVYF